MSSVVKPTTPTRTPSRVKIVDLDHSTGVCPFGKTTLDEIMGKGASGISSLRRNCSPRSNVWLPKGLDVDAHLAHDWRRRLVLEEVRDRWRCPAERVTAGHVDRLGAGLGPIRVKPRLEESGPTEWEDRRPGKVVRRLGERCQLGVPVADVEKGDLLQFLALVQDIEEDVAAGILWSGNSHQESDRRCDVDGAHPGLRFLVLVDARAFSDERRVHVDVPLQVDQFRQVAMLAEELRVRDELFWRLRVGLIRRPEHDHHVTATVRVQRVGAVDVA